MIPNPPWADRILSQHWAEILRQAPDKAWLPVETSASTAKKRKASELGCGHYGCVYATSDPHIVCKITTDVSEVEFVRAAEALGDWPEGIVKYKAVLDIPDSHRRRGVWVLWREAAFAVGDHHYDNLTCDGKIDTYKARAREEALGLLQQFKTGASWVRDVLKNARSPAISLQDAKRWETWAEREVSLEDVAPPLWRPDRARDWKGPQKIAAGLQICAEAALLLQHNTPHMPEVGGALEFYLEHKILLADVHKGNVGLVNRPDYTGPVRVITDPGHAVFLL